MNKSSAYFANSLNVLSISPLLNCSPEKIHSLDAYRVCFCYTPFRNQVKNKKKMMQFDFFYSSIQVNNSIYNLIDFYAIPPGHKTYFIKFFFISSLFSQCFTFYQQSHSRITLSENGLRKILNIHHDLAIHTRSFIV